MIPAGAQVWIAIGHAELRKGKRGLTQMVEQGWRRDRYGDDLFVFRDRAGSL